MLNRMNAPGKFRGALTCRPAGASILPDRLAPGRLGVLRIVLAPLEVFLRRRLADFAAALLAELLVGRQLVENCRLVGPGMRLAPIPMPPYL